MKRIAAAKFKETCLALLDDVDPDGIVITKRGKPVAKLIAAARDRRLADSHGAPTVEWGPLEHLGDRALGDRQASGNWPDRS